MKLTIWFWVGDYEAIRLIMSAEQGSAFVIRIVKMRRLKDKIYWSFYLQDMRILRSLHPTDALVIGWAVEQGTVALIYFSSYFRLYKSFVHFGQVQ